MSECPGFHTVEHPAPALRPDEYLCLRCVRHAERVLGDLPSLVRELETTVTRQNSATGGGGRGSRSHPLPVNLPAAERGRATMELLFEWADFVAGWHRVKGLPVFARYRPVTEMASQAVAILLRYANWMRSNEQGPNLASAIRFVRRDLRRIIDRRPDRLYAGPCHADLGYPSELGYDCRLSMYREWGSDEITCDGHTPNTMPGQWIPSGCGQTHPAATRREWLRAEVESRLLPLRLAWEDLYELVPGCGVDWETAKQWTRERRQRIPQKDTAGRIRVDRQGRDIVRIIVTPPRLEPQAWDGDVPLYRGSDILRLAEDKPVRRGRRRVRRADVA